MVSMLLQSKHANIGLEKFKDGNFITEDEERAGRPGIFEDSELEESLAEDSCQTQEELAQSLGVTQVAISLRLKNMGMIQKQGNWVPYELKPRDVERRFFACEQLLQRQKIKSFFASNCDWGREMDSL